MSRNTFGVQAQWALLVEGLQISVQDFYTTVEEALAAREIPDLTISRVTYKEGGALSAEREYLRVARGNLVYDICGAPYGPKSFFFSWWMARLPPKFVLLKLCGLALVALLFLGIVGSLLDNSCVTLFAVPIILLGLGGGLIFAAREGLLGTEDDVLVIPFVGLLYEKFANPNSYYKHDTATMFRESVKAAFQEAVDHVRSEQGFRALNVAEYTPATRELTN